MNVLIMSAGSRGDIQPYVALALGLQRRGHRVTLAAPQVFEGLARDYGVPFAPVDSRILDLKDAQGATEGKANILKLMKQVEPMLRQMMDDYWTAAQQVRPDLLVFHPKPLVGPAIAEKLDIPGVLSLPLPLMTPTATFPAPIFPRVGLGGAYNRFTYRLIGLLSASYGGMIGKWRRDVLGLPPKARNASDLTERDGSPRTTLYAYSEHVVSRPADWPAQTHATGYWTLPPEDAWQPPQDLLDFLAAGAPPVYIGFGSMGGVDGAKRAQITLDALQRSGQRAVLATGWGGLKLDSGRHPNVFVIDHAPHAWLFERVSAVVHHGGAGTTGAALLAGKPNLVIPFIADQPFWGERVYQLGAGPQPIPQGKLTAEALAAAIQRLTSDAKMRQRAQALGETLRAEDGVARAVAVLEALGQREPVRAGL